MKCKYCHTEIEEGSLFCTNCGKELVNDSPRCSTCGKELEVGMPFCPHCGANQEVMEIEPQNRDIQPKSTPQELQCRANPSNIDKNAQNDEHKFLKENAHVLEQEVKNITMPQKQKITSKRGLLISAILLFIAIISVVLYLWKHNSGSTDPIENPEDVNIISNNGNTDIEGGIAYLKNFYKVLEGKDYELSDPTTSELGKYMTKAALNKLLVDNEYDDGGPAKYYDLDYFTDGQVQGDQHGDYMPEISREITYDSDNWYKIYTQFKDNTPPPTLIRIKVEKLGGNYIISDIEVNTESMPNQTSTSSSQFYDMSGNVSDYPITMHFEINGSQVKGYYYYNRQYEKRGMEAKLNLSGTYANNNLDLNETDANGVPTGHFQGQLHGGIFEGEFVTNQGKRLPFRVK